MILPTSILKVEKIEDNKHTGVVLQWSKKYCREHIAVGTMVQIFPYIVWMNLGEIPNSVETIEIIPGIPPDAVVGKMEMSSNGIILMTLLTSYNVNEGN